MTWCSNDDYKPSWWRDAYLAKQGSGQITQGTLGEWEASDWFDPDVWAAIQWYSLPQEERERAERLEQAMRRASLSNPLAY